MKVIKKPEPDFVLEMGESEAQAFIEECNGLVLNEPGKKGVLIWLLVRGRWLLICPPEVEEVRGEECNSSSVASLF